MAIKFVTALRNARANQVTALVDAGAAGGFCRIYDGTQPATGGAATTLLAELVMSATSFAAAAAGVLTANAITQDSAANAAGDATWCRMTDSNGVIVFDGDVSTTGAFLNLNQIAITVGIAVSISSMVLTEGNP